MENSQEGDSNLIENKKEKIKNWFKNPYNLILVGILVLTLCIRLYYFWITKNQPLWWDESEYMSSAKGISGIIPFHPTWSSHRFLGFPFLISLFYMIGINNEVILRLLLAFIPSIMVIILMYFVLILMYSDKRIALISIAIFSVLWEHVFYSNRFHTENLSLIFGFLAILVLFGVYLKKDFYFIKKRHSLLWISLFLLLCILFRSGNMILIPIMVLFLIIINFYKIPEKSRIPSALGLVVLSITGFVSLIFLTKKYTILKSFYNYDLPINWSIFSVIYGFYQSMVPFIPSVLFYAFIIGLFFVLVSIFIFPEGLKRLGRNIDKNSYKADMFNLILLVSTLFYFVFMFRPPGFEFRWFFIFLPAMFAFTAKGLIKFGDFIQSFLKIKHLSLFLIIFILGLGVYTELNHADQIVKIKIDSYSQIKDSGLWIKENSQKGDIIISASIYQHMYYAEREVIPFPSNEADFEKIIKENKPKYLVISVFESTEPKWSYDWPQRHNNTVVPVNAYFADAEQKQPILVIYKINN
jgi:hypothetical protein